jgi:hypothetical protein
MTQGSPERRMAFKVTMSLRMAAVINNFAGRAAPSEFIGEKPHDGIMLDGNERRHAERLADRGSAAGNKADVYNCGGSCVMWAQNGGFMVNTPLLSRGELTSPWLRNLIPV